MKTKDDFNKIFKDVQSVLVILAHPDDAEVICGGIIARLIQQGKQIRLVITTNGGKGMKNLNIYKEKDFAKLRIDEQIKGALQLGINREQIFNLNIPDGEFENTIDNIEKIVFHIREFKPDIVITHNPEDAINIFTESAKWVNHRDHRHTGLSVIDACYPYSRDRGFFPEQFAESGLSPHNVNKLLFSDSYQHKDRKYFEITDQINIKRNALEAHKFGIGENIDDYIDENKIGDRYFEILRYVEIY